MCKYANLPRSQRLWTSHTKENNFIVSGLHTHKHTHACTHTHTHLNTHTYTHTHTHVHKTHMHTHTHTHTQTHTHTHTHKTHMHTYTHKTHARRRTHARIKKNTNTYTHKHTHHMQALNSAIPPFLIQKHLYTNTHIHFHTYPYWYRYTLTPHNIAYTHKCTHLYWSHLRLPGATLTVQNGQLTTWLWIYPSAVKDPGLTSID